MNSQRTKLHICKPQHTSRCFSLQKSSFLADTPLEIEYLADYNFWTMKYETSHNKKLNTIGEMLIGEFHVTIKNQFITHEI
jgi:hypothetical protein